MRLVLLGPPGAGKGTQANVLSQNLNLIHLSTGNIFRETAKKQDELGKTLSECMQKGILVPDELVNQIVIKRLEDKSIQDKFILDGYPRTKQQAMVLDEFLISNSITLNMVVYMKCSKDVIVERLTGRRVCSSCGLNYHIKNIPPKINGICDKDGARLIQRKDDEKETVLKRIEIYNQKTSELIDYYKEKELLYTVSGNMDARELFKELYKLFDEKRLL